MLRGRTTAQNRSKPLDPDKDCNQDCNQTRTRPSSGPICRAPGAPAAPMQYRSNDVATAANRANTGGAHLKQIVLLVATGIAAATMGSLSAVAIADRIYFSTEPPMGGPPLANGALVGGEFNVAFSEAGGPSAVSGSIERGGVTIATAPAYPTPAPGTSGGTAVLEAVLQPGDVARLFDPKVPGSLAITFTGYPTVNAQCGATTVSGETVAGQPQVFELYDGWPLHPAASKVVITGTRYTATFAKPIPSGTTLLIKSSYVQALPLLEVEIDAKAQPVGPCLPSPPVAMCVVPNLKHRTLARARALLARAHCRLGRVKLPQNQTNRRAVVVHQTPAARTIEAAGSRVSVRLR
jgi:hypothetical protein